MAAPPIAIGSPQDRWADLQYRCARCRCAHPGVAAVPSCPLVIAVAMPRTATPILGTAALYSMPSARCSSANSGSAAAPLLGTLSPTVAVLTPGPWRLSSILATRCCNAGRGGGPYSSAHCCSTNRRCPCRGTPALFLGTAAPLPQRPARDATVPPLTSARRSLLPSLWSCCVLRRYPFWPVSQNGHGGNAVALPRHCPPTHRRSPRRETVALFLYPSTRCARRRCSPLPPRACVLAHSAPAPALAAFGRGCLRSSPLFPAQFRRRTRQKPRVAQPYSRPASAVAVAGQARGRPAGTV